MRIGEAYPEIQLTTEYMKRFAYLMGLAVVAFVASLTLWQDDGYVVNGEFSDWFWTGDAVLSIDNPDFDAEKYEAAVEAAKTNGTAIPDDVKPRFAYDRAPLIEGAFTMRGEIDEPTKVMFYVENGADQDGARKMSIGGWEFILEPGQIEVSLNRINPRTLDVSGGHYNELIYNSYRSDPDYKAAVEEERRLSRELKKEGMSAAESAEVQDALAAKYQEMADIEAASRVRVATTSDDLAARILAVKTARTRGVWVQEALYEILDMDPDNEWARQSLVKVTERLERRNAQSSLTHVIDFEAVDLDGETVALADARSSSKILLLEFWASWCGPCRQEIPNMKTAYELYHDKGFEIFGFTIDDDIDEWREVSEEEDLPWINAGYGAEAEQKELYGVTGVPANFLVNSETGEIIGRHVRGRKLEFQLEQLLGAD